jgi:hypothetical protein
MNRGIVGLFLAAVATTGTAQGWQSPGQSELRVMPGAHAEAPQSRVGQVFWIQPQGRPFSIDIFRAPGMQERFRVEGTRAFVVVGVSRTADDTLIYQLAFETGEQAFVSVAAFESDLYVEPALTSETRFNPSPYLSPEAYLYSIKSIFSEDPDILAERVDKLGPSRILFPKVTLPPPESSK